MLSNIMRFIEFVLNVVADVFKKTALALLMFVLVMLVLFTSFTAFLVHLSQR